MVLLALLLLCKKYRSKMSFVITTALPPGGVHGLEERTIQNGDVHPTILLFYSSSQAHKWMLKNIQMLWIIPRPMTVLQRVSQNIPVFNCP